MVQKMLEQDPVIGVEPTPGYCLTAKVGEGRIGTVYRAERSDPRDVLACKVIPEGKLKPGWEREIQKLTRLRGVPNVVPYHSHGTALDRNHRPFTYVLFDYIDGTNLRQYVEACPSPLDLAFVEGMAKTLLSVFHACHTEDIRHGDLHEGNILISNPDRRLPGSPRTVWITDFGYGGSHNELEPKDDYRQCVAIIVTLLDKIDYAELNARDRAMHTKFREFLRKQVLEVDPTQGLYVANPELLLQELAKLGPAAERESASGVVANNIKDPGDYLWAEALGYRADEWRNLFVPEFLAAQELLSRNITVLTGARGCGKTMAFRRLTLYMDKVIGEPSGVRGADQFTGFYLNCRDLAEVFPWVPPRLTVAMQQQLIHYFHLAWLAEICKTLSVCDPDRRMSLDWIDEFFSEIFPGRYQPLPRGMDALTHARAFLEAEKERCRLQDLGKGKGLDHWPVARLDFLDVLQLQLESHVPWVSERPIYLFLDDYTVPIVPSQVQRVLNPIIFKRRSKLFFKVSTEAPNSFEREGLREKPLEVYQDFELIDLATESLHQHERVKTRLLEKIFCPRIDRHPAFHGKGFSLQDILGTLSLSNNKLARRMRGLDHDSGAPRRVTYHGIEAFVGMWASDIRTMIQMFVDILREANGALDESHLPIADAIQDKSCRSKGGEFLVFTESIRDAAAGRRVGRAPDRRERLGEHLRNIAEAFIRISRYELTKAPEISNEGRLNPRQAFRLEITDKFELPDDLLRYYHALVRWHIFLQDWRGKSVRGMITPRLYLNRVLIPYANLTFSSHDNIPFTNEQFALLLRDPQRCVADWEQNRSKRRRAIRERTLWDDPLEYPT